MVKTRFTLHYILVQVSCGFSAKAQNNNGSAVHNTMALGKQKNLDNIYLERSKTFHTHLCWNIKQQRKINRKHKITDKLNICKGVHSQMEGTLRGEMCLIWNYCLIMLYYDKY